jgi:hypothetical protein
MSFLKDLVIFLVSCSILSTVDILKANFLIEYAACTTPGDSGSPVWSWWEDGPYIVGLMTEVGSQLGVSAGWGPAGQALVNLVSQARSLYP